MSDLALIHVIAIAFWLGVVAVETVFEKAPIDKNAIAHLHSLTDRFVEIPIVVIVLISGLLLWAQADWTLQLLPKVLAGVGAVAANFYCYYCVEKRSAKESSFDRMSKLIEKSALIGFVCFVAALYLGVRYTSG